MKGFNNRLLSWKWKQNFNVKILRFKIFSQREGGWKRGCDSVSLKLEVFFLNILKKEESVGNLKYYRDKMKSRVEISSLVGLLVGKSRGER